MTRLEEGDRVELVVTDDPAMRPRRAPRAPSGGCAATRGQPSTWLRDSAIDPVNAARRPAASSASCPAAPAPSAPDRRGQ
jgi:hypothetical protein